MKATLIHDLIVNEKVDLVCIIETWLGQEAGFASLRCAQLGSGLASAKTPG